MRTTLSCVLSLCLAAGSALAGGNLVTNGSFERVDDEGGPEYWHYHLTDFMPETVREEDGNRTYHYICACGHDLGPVKPWVGLFCPKCKGFISGEECGAWYVKNHTRVSMGPGERGKAVKFTLPRSVGRMQGVRIFSRLIKAKRGWGYKLKFSVKTKGSAHPRVFVEGYRFITPGGSRYASKYMSEVPEELNPYGMSRPLERKFRAQVNCKSSSSWKTYTKEFVAPERYQFDVLAVKLYAYMPGEAYFDNVVLQAMSRSEMREYYENKRKAKADRFRHERD